MLYPITFESNPRPENIQVLGNGIMGHAKQKTKHTPMEFFAFFVRDPQQKIIGGCNGSTLYGCLYIDQLWVDESIRKQGYGSHLIHSALAFGLEKHCTFATVNTMSFEALGFYQKLGFEIEFQRTGFEHGSVFYFLRKSLVPEPMDDKKHNNTTIRKQIQNKKLIPWQNDEVISQITEELKEKHQCHTIILYGSRARGDYTSTSDYDIAGISDHVSNKKWLAHFDESKQVFHDVFIFPTNELCEPNDSHLQLSDGIVIYNTNHFGSILLQKLQELIKNPIFHDRNELHGRKIWYQKMIKRAEINDLEGQYRQVWVIHALLEDYFAFKQLRYMGPKKAFQYLKQHDLSILELFKKALSNPSNTQAVKALITTITNESNE